MNNKHTTMPIWCIPYGGECTFGGQNKCAGCRDNVKKLFFITYGNNLIGCYTKIEAESYTTARKIAHEGTNKGKYAFMYEGQAELDRQITLGYLRGGEVELQPMSL